MVVSGITTLRAVLRVTLAPREGALAVFAGSG